MMPILIPAAGASSRMRGQDKLAMEVDGAPLLQRQVDMSLSVSDDVRVALPCAPHPRHGLVPPPARRIEVPDAADGMAASLRRLVATLGDTTPAAMILLADLPEITRDDLLRVLTATRSNPDALIWRGATETGKPGHPLVVSAPLYPKFAALVGDTGGQQILRAHARSTQLVPLPDQHALRDLDTPEDWAAWRAQH